MKIINKQKIGKKGYAYLLITSIVIAIVLIVFLTKESYKYQDKQNVEELRIRAMNSFVKGFNQDISRATYISSFRTLLALEDTIASTGIFFNNTEEQFKETLYFGTINGSVHEIMANSTLQDYLVNVNTVANKMGITIQANISNITLSQKNPWEIEVVITANITIQDNEELVAWQYEKEFKTELPIENLRDPIYSSFTNNRVPNTVRKNPYAELVNQTTNDTTNLQEFINNSYYIESTDAPTFLMRFENNNTADQNGIESIVYIKALSDQDLEVFSNRIKVDFMYFNNINDTKICGIENIPENYELVLPSNRVNTYELNNLNYTSC